MQRVPPRKDKDKLITHYRVPHHPVPSTHNPTSTTAAGSNGSANVVSAVSPKRPATAVPRSPGRSPASNGKHSKLFLFMLHALRRAMSDMFDHLSDDLQVASIQETLRVLKIGVEDFQKLLELCPDAPPSLDLLSDAMGKSDKHAADHSEQQKKRPTMSDVVRSSGSSSNAPSHPQPQPNSHSHSHSQNQSQASSQAQAQSQTQPHVQTRTASQGNHSNAGVETAEAITPRSARKSLKFHGNQQAAQPQAQAPSEAASSASSATATSPVADTSFLLVPLPDVIDFTATDDAAYFGIPVIDTESDGEPASEPASSSLSPSAPAAQSEKPAFRARITPEELSDALHLKQRAAARNRQSVLSARSSSARATAARAQSAFVKRNQALTEKKESIRAKHETSETIHQSHIETIVNKAVRENEKVHEVIFISQEKRENERLEKQQRMEEKMKISEERRLKNMKELARPSPRPNISPSVDDGACTVRELRPLPLLHGSENAAVLEYRKVVACVPKPPLAADLRSLISSLTQLVGGLMPVTASKKQNAVSIDEMFAFIDGTMLSGMVPQTLAPSKTLERIADATAKLVERIEAHPSISTALVDNHLLVILTCALAHLLFCVADCRDRDRRDSVLRALGSTCAACAALLVHDASRVNCVYAANTGLVRIWAHVIASLLCSPRSKIPRSPSKRSKSYSLLTANAAGNVSLSSQMDALVPLLRAILLVTEHAIPVAAIVPTGMFSAVEECVAAGTLDMDSVRLLLDQVLQQDDFAAVFLQHTRFFGLFSYYMCSVPLEQSERFLDALLLYADGPLMKGALDKTPEALHCLTQLWDAADVGESIRLKMCRVVHRIVCAVPAMHSTLRHMFGTATVVERVVRTLRSCGPGSAAADEVMQCLAAIHRTCGENALAVEQSLTENEATRAKDAKLW